MQYDSGKNTAEKTEKKQSPSCKVPIGKQENNEIMFEKGLVGGLLLWYNIL